MGIKLRKKKLKNGENSLYLDIYHKGEHWYDFLGLRLVGDPESDNEILRIANDIIKEYSELLLMDKKLDVKNRVNNLNDANLYVNKINELGIKFDQSFAKMNNRINSLMTSVENLIKCFESTPKARSEILDIKQAAGFLKVSLSQMYKYTHRKQIPFHKKGKKLLFNKFELIDWLSNDEEKIIKKG